MDRRQEKRPSRNLDENYDELERLRKQVESAEKRAKRPLRKTSSSSTDASQDGCGSSGDPGAEPIRRLCRNELRRRYKAGCNAPDPPLFNRILALQILFRGMLRKLEYQPCIPPRGTWFHEIKHDGYRLLVQREGKRVRLLTRRGYYPLITEAFAHKRISVGEPYFNTMALPFALLMLFLMGVGPICLPSR